jgi:ribosomal protein S18 acetylase RimI-like enzyme
MHNNKTQIAYRKATSFDVKDIALLHYETINNSLKEVVPTICKFSELELSLEAVEKNIEEMAQDPDHDIIVACLDNKIIGFLSVWLETYTDDLITAPFSTIEYIEVNPNYRSLGIGQSFMKEAERIAKSKNHQYLELSVWETNKSAIRLYERNDFTPIVRRMVKKL